MNRSRFWSSLIAVARKEFIHMRRDRSVIAAALIMPIIQLGLYGFIDTTVYDIPMVVVDQDHSRFSRDLIEDLQATKTFKIKYVTEDSEVARHLIRSARANVGIVIPADFHDRRADGRDAHIMVLIDGSDSAVGAQALAAVNGLVAQQNLQTIEGATLVGTKPRPESLAAHSTILFNPSGRTANFMIPALIAVILNMITVTQTAIAIVRERERGTLEQLLVTPIDPLGLTLGKVLPYLVVGIVEVAGILTVMRWIFSVPIAGSVVFLFGMLLIYEFALLSLGLFISSVARTANQAQQMSMMFMLPAIILSGYVFPTRGLPLPLYLLGQVMPVTQMVSIVRGVVLRDAGFIDLLPNVAALTAMAASLMLLTTWRMKKVSLV